VPPLIFLLWGGGSYFLKSVIQYICILRTTNHMPFIVESLYKFLGASIPKTQSICQTLHYRDG